MSRSPNKAAIVRAGVTVHLRAHGLTVPTSETIGLVAASRAPENPQDPKVEIYVGTDGRLARISAPSAIYGVQGSSTAVRLGDSNRSDPDTGEWALVRASRLFPVHPDLMLRFKHDPQGVMDEMDRALGRQVEEELAPVADLMSGLLALRYSDNPMEMRVRGRAYWHAEHSIQESVRYPMAMQMLAPAAFDSATMQPDLARIVRLIQAKGPPLQKETRKLALSCSRWLLAAHGLPANSPERFMMHFRCLERIARLCDPNPVADKSRGMSRLLSFIQQLDAEDEQQWALEFVEGQAAKLDQSIPIAASFGRVAHAWRPESAGADIAAFTVLKRIRDAISHGSSAEIPTEEKGLRVDATARSLAFAYFDEFVKHRWQPAVTRSY